MLFWHSVAQAAEMNAAALPLADVIRLDEQTLPFEGSVALPLPPLPAKPGEVIVLRFRAVSYADRVAGCNYNMALKLNDAVLGRYTAGGDERLIGREPMFEFAQKWKGQFQIFSGPNMMVMFAPSAQLGDAMSTDGQGATFAMDISDVARGVDGNTLTIRNIRKKSAIGKRLDLLVRDIEVGWLDKKLLPRGPSLIPERGPMRMAVAAGKLRLYHGNAGGFSVDAMNRVELLVETGIGMKGDTRSDLLADDEARQGAKARAAVEPFGSAGFRTTAVWPGVRLVRTVEIRGDLVLWKERWTNTGDDILGLPFRHRLFLRGETGRFRLAGDPDVTALAGSPKNPTVFVGSREHPGDGMGITAESDWLRLLMWLRAAGGVGEIYSESLALPMGASIDFAMTIAAVRDGGGYWSFINHVRRRWGVNGYCARRPFFSSYWRAPHCKSTEERFRKSLSHLGPITVAFSPWQRLEPDARLVRRGAYPKLPRDASPAPGKTPDLDIEAFLTWRHREAYQQHFAKQVEIVHRVCPQVQVVQKMHPAMETVYKPLAHRWPFAEDVIRTAAGAPFESSTYSRVWLRDYAGKDWGILYYVPRPGSAYLAVLLRSVRESMDRYNSDGIYCDEFSWAGLRRGYSRYDYSRWDGYSADLDESGKVARLKSDNAFTAEVSQLEIVREVLSRGKFFLGNGAGVLRSVTNLPIARFTEGGNGYGAMAGAHLTTVPLILGNFRNCKTREDVFDGVKTCLSIGCIYSPQAENLLLEGSDNFVCKLYPITIREIGPGTVKAEERLITTESGAFDWPGQAALIRLYEYDSKGGLISKDAVVKTAPDHALNLTVPQGGLIIAERKD